jgi:signal transduction histidine kinase
LRDIQERQAKLESKVTLGSIVAEVLHEGRAPVSAIHREAQRLLEYFETLFDTSDEALRKRSEVPGILTDISEQSERLRRLFRILSPLSGRRRGPPKAYPIKSTIDDAIKLYRPRLEKLRVITNISLENNTLKSFGYRDDLIVAISNLIENSLYWFEAKQTAYPEINFSIEIGKKELSLDISDNGPGIPEDFKDKVFDVGFSLRPRGTGLGLSIAQEALSRSNGEIELIAPKPGCTFRITLPAYRE